MSILCVSDLNHGFGDRTLLKDVSFRLLKGEHVGLVGANGEGKSTFLNIITGKMMPDEGKVEWAKDVRVGYLDQHSVLEPGMTIRDVLKSAFEFLYDVEARMTELCAAMGEASDEELPAMMEEFGNIQDLLDVHDFYIIDTKIDEIAHAFGLDAMGLDTDVTALSGGQRTKVLLGKLLLEKPDILLLDEPTNYLDVEHIEWLKRYLIDYENAFILISHDIPFLNSVINLVYHMENGCPRNLAMPLWHWGKFYELLIRTIMDGNWKSDDNSVVQKAINYWWGMSAGVVDVICSRTLPNGTKRLIELLKKNICEGTFQPFAGELYSQDGVLQSDLEDGLTPEEIVGMDWLVENVVGRIPTEEELVETAIPVVLQQGVEKKG